MAKPKTIRALQRGLEVMQFLQHQHAATLNDIYHATGLPRPTLLRILRTLELSGLVRRGMGDGLYRNGYRLQRLAEHLDESDRLAEVVAPVLDRLCAKVKWPSDLTVLNRRNPDDPFMELKETSRPHSPFMVNTVGIGHRINIPLSAVGQVYLAFCGDAEREDLIARLAASDDPTNRLARDRRALDEMLQTVRRDGYACRDSKYRMAFKGMQPIWDDGLQAIAVPIRTDGHIHGAITMLWLRQAMEVSEFVATYLDDLQAAVDEIGRALTAEEAA